MAVEERGVILPAGVAAPVLPDAHQVGTVVNETGLPDDAVLGAVESYFEEHASVLGANTGTSFQSYSARGSLLARAEFRTPANVIDEIVLARDMAERDDDIGAAIGSMIALAFSEGWRNLHPDEVELGLFDKAAKRMKLATVFKELYREYLISSSMTSVAAYVSAPESFTPEGADRARTRNLVAPRVGVLPAEQIRIVGNDMFGTGTLAYKPSTGSQERWLEEFFSASTSPARKAEMRREDPVLTSLLLEQVEMNETEAPTYVADTVDQGWGKKVYRLNPRMVHRTTMPKGAWKYPRPLLTRDFALLEAKRMLNLMDYALLQGGSNFLVIAKKGSKEQPGKPAEISNLRDQIRRASRTGVLVGDHRVAVEIITPDLKELLNASKRNLIGRKLANGLLRVPEAEEDTGGEGSKARMSIVTRVVTEDRNDVRRHIEDSEYERVYERNGLSRAATIWFPKLLMSDTEFWDYVMKMRDRGDISRQTAVEVGGWDYATEVQKRKREKPDDKIMVPAEVPFSGGGGPQDTGGGRPPGGSPDNGRPGARTSSGPARARPTRVVQRNAGETVRAFYEEGVGSYRAGEITAAILEEYPDAQRGRLTSFEARALGMIELDGDPGRLRDGVLHIIPVNVDYEMANVRPVRLADGLSMLVGDRVEDDALVARALVFREPAYNELDAEERALAWGFPRLELPAGSPPDS